MFRTKCSGVGMCMYAVYPLVLSCASDLAHGRQSIDAGLNGREVVRFQRSATPRLCTHVGQLGEFISREAHDDGDAVDTQFVSEVCVSGGVVVGHVSEDLVVMGQGVDSGRSAERRVDPNPFAYNADVHASASTRATLSHTTRDSKGAATVEVLYRPGVML
jgi:hypothetical protein